MSESSIDDASGLDRPMTGSTVPDVERDMLDPAPGINPDGSPALQDEPNLTPDEREEPTPDYGGNLPG